MKSHAYDLFCLLKNAVSWIVGAMLRTETPFDIKRAIAIELTPSQNVLIVVHEGERRDEIMTSGGRLVRLSLKELSRNDLAQRYEKGEFHVLVIEEGVLEASGYHAILNLRHMIPDNVEWIDAPRQSA